MLSVWTVLLPVGVERSGWLRMPIALAAFESFVYRTIAFWPQTCWFALAGFNPSENAI